MTKQEIQALIDAKIAGQGSAVDVGGALPTILSEIIDTIQQADWNEADSTKPDFIKNKPTIPAAQVQADWNEADNTKPDYIKNKPNALQTLEITKFPTNGANYGDGLDEMGITEQQAKDLFSGKYQFIKDKANEYILAVGTISYTGAETGEGAIVAGIVGVISGACAEMQADKTGGWEVTVTEP